MHLKPVTHQKIEELAALSQRCFIATFGHLYQPEDLQSHLNEKRSPAFFQEVLETPSEKLLFIPHDGDIAGYLLYGAMSLPLEGPKTPSIELKHFYLDEAFQGLGLGKAALKAFLNLPEVQAVSSVYLGVWEDNIRAKSLYASFGFQAVGAYNYFVGTHVDHEIIMEKANHTG